MEVKSKCRTTKYFHVRAQLVRAAQYRGLTTYQNIGVIMALPLRGSHMAAEAGQVLGEISEDEVLAARPMFSAVAGASVESLARGFTVFRSN